MKNYLFGFGLLTFSAAALAAEPAVDFHDHIGIQMWSLRDTASKDTPAAFDLVKSYGLTEIETAGLGTLTLDQYVAEVKSHGLTVVGAHIGYDELKKDLPGAIATAKALGAKYIVCPWIPHGKDGFTEAQAHEVAANFNTWGKVCREAGLQLGWHPHGFEFVASDAGNGETRFDIVANETEPENLVFEMDVFWVLHAGQDPATLLKKYGSRWVLMHVKDMRKGVTTRDATGGASPTDNVAVGEGQIDWPTVLRTAQDVGLKYYILEDETTAPLTNIPLSLAYLRALKL